LDRTLLNEGESTTPAGPAKPPTAPWPGWALYLFIVVGCALAYLPAINNSFISDDFTLMRFLEELRQDPSKLWNTASEFFRSMSYVYFSLTFSVFGKVPEFHYIASIGLHILTSLLVFKLIRTMTGRTLAAWVGAIFFAVYARHEEAVMWISANNSTIVAISCLVFLVLWERYLSSRTPGLTYAAVVGALLIALFSKESAVVLAPLALIRASAKWPLRRVIRTTMPLFVLCFAFGLFWISQAYRNFFVVDGHYAVTSNVFLVFPTSLFNLLSSATPFLIALAIQRLQNRRAGVPFSWQPLSSNHVGTYFLLWAGLGFVPISFLTYAKYVASRNTYFPSVALAALVGLMVVTLLENTKPGSRYLWTTLVVGVMVWNVQFIWRRQDHEYVKRAAPTVELIALINQTAELPEKPLRICDFPLHPSIGAAAVTEFTSLSEQDVVFEETCNDDDATFARWKAQELRYQTIAPATARQ